MSDVVAARGAYLFRNVGEKCAIFKNISKMHFGFSLI